MAVEGEIKFGLNVNRALADVVNNKEALANLGIDINDLDVIRGAAGDLGITSDDVKALSGLNVPLQTYLTKLYQDTQQYAAIIDQTAGTTETLKGNLVINGQLGASSIKYQYIDQDNSTLKVADISTSRVSSWSSSAPAPAPEDAPIFYGGQVEIDGPVRTANLELIDPALEVRFRNSEVPTHKIEVTVNGSTMYFYAMKGIPLVFEGFFRNFNSDLRLISSGAVSWRVVNLQVSYLTREYENVGGAQTTRSFLRYRDTSAARKNIEIYHNPNNIRTLPLEGVGLEELPAASLEGLQFLYISRNVIKTMPDFTVFSPNVLLLDIRENNLELSEESDTRKFNNAVLSRIPTTVTELRVGNTFNGSITAEIKPTTVTGGNFEIGKEYTILSLDDGLGGTATDFTAIGASDNILYLKFTATGAGTGTGTAADLSTGLPNLITLNMNSHNRGGARNFFGRDSDDPTGSLPEVHITCRNYYAYRNAFDAIPDSIMDLPDLRQLNLYQNSINEDNFQLVSDTLDYVNIGSNPGINIPNLSGKTTLRNFYSHYNRASGVGTDIYLLITENGQYKFENCSSLIRIYCYSNNFLGPIPKFKGNNVLYQFEARYSRLTGGKELPFAENAADISAGRIYRIETLGTTNWNSIAGTTGISYQVGDDVKAVIPGNGDGTTTDVTGQEYVLFDDLFDDCQASMQYFRISSSSLLNKPLHPNVFAKCSNMRGLEIRSFNRGVTGNIPSLAAMQQLRYIVFLQNNFEGPMPNFFNNPLVYYVHLYQNRLNGTIPNIQSTEMRYLYLHRNEFTAFNGMSTPNLLRLFISYNQITGSIPDMNNFTKCYDLYMNNNQFTGYVPGALIGMAALRRFDISNNPTLTASSVNNIIADLVENYNQNPRSGVACNLSNTATATGEAVEQIEFLRSKGWNMRN